MQYISHPTYTWETLREEHPGICEHSVQPAPDPNSWVHLRVAVNSPRVSVDVGDAKQASLVVEELGDRKEGWVGLWVGPG